MKQFYLTENVTKDKLVHQGLFYQPKKKSKRAMLFVHGLTGTFYNHVKLFELFASACENSGIGFAAFNNRGHDIVTGIRKIDPKEPKGYTKLNGGAGYERFEDCVYDIDAGISFLVKQGYSEIILAGHSTGANKVCYYGGTKKDARVAGIILLSPVSDRLDPALDKKTIDKQLLEMKKKIEEGRGDELLSGVHVFPMTPRRFVSLYSPRSSEDTFDYGDTKPTLTYFSAIHAPLLLLIGSLDEYLDRPVKKFLDVFDQYARSKNYKSIIIPGALHGFNGKENIAVDAMFRWVRGI